MQIKSFHDRRRALDRTASEVAAMDERLRDNLKQSRQREVELVKR